MGYNKTEYKREKSRHKELKEGKESMKRKRIIAVFMAIVLILSFLPAVTFAASEGGAQALGGELRIKGFPAVGNKLEADLSAVTPAGLTKDKFTYTWTKQEGAQTKTLSSADSYTLAAADEGAVIKLTAVPKPETGLTGQLVKESGKVNKQGVTPTPAPTGTPGAAAGTPGAPTVTPAAGETQQSSVTPTPQAAWDGNEPEGTGNPSGPAGQSGTENGTNPEPENTQSQESNQGNEGINSSIPAPAAEQPKTEEPVVGNTVQGTEGTQPSSDVFPYQNTNEDENNMQPSDVIYDIQAEPKELDFGKLEEGYKNVSAKTVTIKNAGNTDRVLKEASSAYFDVENIAGVSLAAGESKDIKIVPKEGLAAKAESYKETITITTDKENVQTTITVSFQVAEKEEEEKPGLTIVSGKSLDFGKTEEGETAPKAQEVTIENSGNVEISVKKPESDAYEISGLPKTLDKGEKYTFTVRPKSNLSPDNYSESLVLTTSPELDPKLSFSCKYKVETKKVYDFEVSSKEIRFSSAVEGYSSADTKEVVITNTGNQELELTRADGDEFIVGNLSRTKIGPNESASFTITPKIGLGKGEHVDAIKVQAKNTTKEEIVKAYFTVDAQTFKVSVSPRYLDFGSKLVGYTESPAAQSFRVTNTGTGTLTLKKPASTDVFQVTAEGFDAEGLKQLKPGESLTVTVQPKLGMGYNKDAYVQAITVQNNNNLKIESQAAFRVNKATLIGVNTNMRAIEGLPNGSPKTAEGLKLPKTTTIYVKELGKVPASISWNVEGCDYDPSSTRDQKFTVYGTILLPSNVGNPYQLSLSTWVEVSVKAYDAKVAKASDNRIEGIENGATYKMDKSITMKFKAIGAGMTNTSPRKGDVRYLPYDWKVGGYGEKFDNSDYEDSFKVTKANKYTLKVNFIRQEYNGEQWVKKGESDTKKVEFIIKSSDTKSSKNTGKATATKKPTPTPKTKSAVNTGDETPIGAWVAVFVVAVGCIAGILIYQTKKRK